MSAQQYGRKQNAQFLPKDSKRWSDAAFKKLQATGSIDHAEKYANNASKAAIHRRMRSKNKHKGVPGAN